MKITAIVQARMGSTRLPRKVLADILGQPLIFHVFDRIAHSTHIDSSVLATTTASEDDELEQWALSNNHPVYRGSIEDVLERYYQCAREHGTDTIVRITADDAFKDPVITDRIIETLIKEELDYCSNTIIPTFPEGVDVEVFSFEALEQAYNEATKTFEREHVTPYIWSNPEEFKLINIENSIDYSSMRWTIDTAADLEFARAVYKQLYVSGKVFLMDDVIELLNNEPEIMQLMPRIKRNLGLETSIEKENETNR